MLDDGVLAYLFVGACLLSFSAGLVLTLVLDNINWLWLCLPIILFLS